MPPLVIGFFILLLIDSRFIFLPMIWGVLKLVGGLSFYLWDRKRIKKLPSLPCDGHKGTWSNPKYFTEEELKSKD